jgi:glyoxylase-like metal-dependent hydrolase (beta-lactamase superfamily II)
VTSKGFIVRAAVVWAACLGTEAGLAAEPVPPHIIYGSFTAERQPDGNTILFEDKDGLVVIDTGRHLDHQDKILAYARSRDKPIRTIVNSHWHLDHSGGNAELRAVHPTARLYTSNAVLAALDGFLARGLERARARLADPGLAETERAEAKLGVDAIQDRRNLIPDVAVTGPMDLQLADRVLKLNLAVKAATDGDVWIYDPATRTVIVGDLVVLPAPFFDTACPDGWSRALGEIAAIPFTTLVPGHGTPMSRIQFDTYRMAFDKLLACGKTKAIKQACIDGWLADASSLLASDQDRKDAQMLLDYYVDEILRSPEKKDEYCGSVAVRPEALPR